MITQEEFLARRGDRTLRLGYGGACPTDEVALVIRPAALRSPAARPAVVAAANLLGRWVPKLSVYLPAETGAPLTPLATAIQEAVRAANPFLSIRWGSPRGGHPSLAIGPGPASRDEVTAWADGWVAVSSSGSSSPCHSEPITSVLLFAVALGVGRVFREAWDLAAGGPFEVRWNTWLHTLESEAATHEQRPRPNGPPNLGRVLQVGAGAVGSNIIYFLGLMGASADVVLIDHDVVKIENLDRSLLFGLRDAFPLEIPKVEAAVRAAEPFPVLRVQPNRAKWAEYAARTYRVGNFDLALALANEDQVWPAMGHALLPLTLQATTDGDWGVAFGAHAPGTGYCLGCRFPPDSPTLPTMCSKGAIEIEATPGAATTVHASLPFQSAAAAGLLAVEIDKLALDPIERAPNYVEGRLGVTEQVLSLHRGPAQGCPICRDFPEDLWTAKYGSTLFARHQSRTPKVELEHVSGGSSLDDQNDS